jgi:hypothetical protein
MTIQSITASMSPSVADPEAPSPSDPSPTSGVDDCGALLPAPMPLAEGDLAAEIALLNIRAGRDEAQINTVAEETQNELQDAAEQNEVNEMHQEAGDIMSNAVAAGILQVAQGTTQVVGGGVTSGMSGPAAQGAQMEFQGGSTLFGAGAALFTANGQASQQLDQALVTSYKAVADRAQQTSTEATEGQQDARSVIANAIQFYQQYEAAQSQTNLIAAGQRA